MALTPQRPRRGKAALDQLYKGVVKADLRPLMFLDFDDTLCLGKPYSGFDVFQPEESRPEDLWERLWHPPAVDVLNTIVREFSPQVVLTTSWIRLLPREGFVEVFTRSGLSWLADALHPAWSAPQAHDATRWQSVEAWLNARYEGQPLVVLDDTRSGSGLRGSKLQRTGRVVLCQPGIGLHADHLPAIRQALSASGNS